MEKAALLSIKPSLCWSWRRLASSLCRISLSSAGRSNRPGNRNSIAKKYPGLWSVCCHRQGGMSCSLQRLICGLPWYTLHWCKPSVKEGDVTLGAFPVWASAGALWQRFLRLMMEKRTSAFSITSKAIRVASSVLWYSASRGKEEPFINISGNTVSTLTCFAHSFSVSRNLSDQNQFTLFY